MKGWRPFILPLALLLAVSGVPAPARESGLEALEMERLLEQATGMFERSALSIEEMSADFEYRCLRSFGDPDFCGCLVRRRPYPLRFEQYIGITSRTRPELDYDALGDTGKRAVDEIYLLRDACVGR